MEFRRMDLQQILLKNCVLVDSPLLQLTSDREAEFALIANSPSEDFGVSQYLFGLEKLTDWGY